MCLETKKYHIGISYASEDLSIVENVVKALERKGLNVFFDQNEDAIAYLAGRNLIYTLQEIYTTECKYCMIFVSEAYKRKAWTGYEAEAILLQRVLDRQKNINTDYLIPVFIDCMDLPGLNSGIIGFDLKKFSPEKIAATMHQKVFGYSPRSEESLITISELFKRILSNVTEFLNTKYPSYFKINSNSEYDFVFNFSSGDHNQFLRVILDIPDFSLLKIFTGEKFLPQYEHLWNAEIYIENQQIYFINYNFSSEIPGIPQMRKEAEVISIIIQYIETVMLEKIYV